MYNKKYVGILALMLGIAFTMLLTLMYGCSDSSSGPSIVQGDLSDPDFVAVKASIEESVDSVIFGSYNPMTNHWGFPLDSTTYKDKDDWWLGPLGDDDSVKYSFNSVWHIIEMTHLSASGSEVYYDSMAFVADGEYQRNYTSEVDQILYRGSRTLIQEGASGTDTIDITIRVDLEDVNTTQAQSEGDVLIDMVLNNSGSRARYVYDVDVDSLAYSRTGTSSWQTYNSVSGAFDASMDYITSSVDQDWTVDVTVSGGTAAIKATKGNTQWTYNYSHN
ncbi:MAG: hypothetical protein GF404_01980 [candidate division Zixibacteria bacterium]|nr:hypothetical protein [candidate division Zixibacteria bacterium]